MYGNLGLDQRCILKASKLEQFFGAEDLEHQDLQEAVHVATLTLGGEASQAKVL